MSKYSLTKNEIELLKYAYIDDDRIEEGELFDYQVEALHMIRKCSVYLKVRYPKYDLMMISFLPQTKKKSYVEIHFKNNGSDVTYTLRCQMKEDKDVFSDNFYDVPFEAEYDKKIEKILKNKDVSARVYTVFPFLISEEIKSASDLFNMKNLSRNTSIFIGVEELPSQEEVNEYVMKIEKIFLENSINTNGILYFILDNQDMNRDISYFDEYVKDRKNLKNLVSIAFRVM